MKVRLTSLKWGSRFQGRQFQEKNKGTQELVQDPIDSLEEIKKSFHRNVLQG